MKIRCKMDDGVEHLIETPCKGCMCHEMAMKFGDGNICQQCGCPVNKEGFKEMLVKNTHES